LYVFLCVVLLQSFSHNDSKGVISYPVPNNSSKWQKVPRPKVTIPALHSTFWLVFPAFYAFIRVDTLTFNSRVLHEAVIDRRRSSRYAAASEVEYRIVTSGTALHGTGRLIDVSETGILFEPDRPLPPRSEIEMAIPWPMRTPKSAPLELRIHGYSVRTQNNSMAVVIRHYEFGICKSPLLRRARVGAFAG
jgi:hypothetical protein